MVAKPPIFVVRAPQLSNKEKKEQDERSGEIVNEKRNKFDQLNQVIGIIHKIS